MHLIVRVFAFMVGVAFGVIAASPVQAQATLDVQTANSQSTFHVGERISLVLTFRSPDDNRYTIAPYGSGNRGDEFDSEHFDVSPSTGWSDPLATYFTALTGLPRTGHGWPAQKLLSSRPYELSLDLNQWVRFDQPGVYHIIVISRRVYDTLKDAGNRGGLQSNVLELKIVPAKADWQDATLKTIVARLAAGPIAGKSYEDAVGDLRYLATPAAIEQMTDELRHGSAFVAMDSKLGLVGLPDSLRSVAIASMNRRIEEPDFPITPLFVSTLSLLHVKSGSTADSIQHQRQSFEPVLLRAISDSISGKGPIARAQTIQTLVTVAPSFKVPDADSQMPSTLSASFLSLDQRSQIDDLRQHWDLLDSPSFLPTLQTLAEVPAKNDATLGPYSTLDLKSAAFKRWYELDPAGARSEILAEIGNLTPALSAQAVDFLPDKSLPQFEDAWADSFAQADDPKDQRQAEVLGSLLVRFGTGAATPQMLAKLNAPLAAYTCMVDADALAYLIKFKPSEARAPLQREIPLGEETCDNSFVRWISENATGSVLNEEALKALDNPDLLAVGDALQYLTSYGTQADERPIWEHYVKWADEWSSKASILDHPQPGMHPCGEVCTGEFLGQALIANQGWLADQALIARVLQKCVGQEVCKRLEDIARSASPPYRVVVPNAASPNGVAFPRQETYSIGQYRAMSRDLLEAKMKQYPRGTKFLLSDPWPATEDQRKLEAEIQALFAQNGMSLERPNN